MVDGAERAGERRTIRISRGNPVSPIEDHGGCIVQLAISCLLSLGDFFALAYRRVMLRYAPFVEFPSCLHELPFPVAVAGRAAYTDIQGQQPALASTTTPIHHLSQRRIYARNAAVEFPWAPLNPLLCRRRRLDWLAEEWIFTLFPALLRSCWPRMGIGAGAGLRMMQGTASGQILG
jgi:hypothetical protein